jgi:hypothetical protein
VACIAFVYSIALALLRDDRGAAIAAGLFALLPPFAGYLFVVYPEIVVSFVFLAGIAWLVRGRGTLHAAVAGVLFALGALFRETLPRFQSTWRGSAPGHLKTSSRRSTLSSWCAPPQGLAPCIPTPSTRASREARRRGLRPSRALRNNVRQNALASRPTLGERRGRHAVCRV